MLFRSQRLHVLLVGVPFFIGGIVSLMNPQYMQPLFHTHPGHLLLFGGLAMMGDRKSVV